MFTPLEYGTVGLSEEDALEQYGEDNLEVIRHRPCDICYVVIISVNIKWMLLIN